MTHSLSSEAYKSLILERVGKMQLTWAVCRKYCYNRIRRISARWWDWIKSAEDGSPNLLLTTMNIQFLKRKLISCVPLLSVIFPLTVLFRASIYRNLPTVVVHATGPSVGKHVVILKCNIHFQWLRCCATNRKVAGSIPAGVNGFFIDIISFRSHYGPGVDWASDRNEY